MGKISQWLIDKEERGEVIYDEQRKRYQDRAGAVARSASEGDAESECVRGIMSLAPEESFFIATDDEDHTQRKVSALRQRVHRIQIAAPDKQFTVRKRHENNQMGVRVFRLPNENN